MQSDPSQHRIVGSKSPYLSQYKQDVSAKQKQIRQRLGVASSNLDNYETDNGADNNLIPSIDDEIIEHLDETTTSRRIKKSQFSYFDNEAEASLQFFKKNLLPNANNESYNMTASSRPAPATRSLFEKRIEPRESSLDFTTKNNNDQLDPSQARASFPSDRYDTPKTPLSQQKQLSSSPYQIGSGKPVPFKQTSLNEPATMSARIEKSYIERPPKRDLPTITNNQASNYHSRQSSAASRTSAIDSKPTTSDRLPRQRSGSGASTGSKAKIYERAAAISQASVENMNNELIKADNNRYSIQSASYEGRRTPESPNPSGSFSRKPLYNSLLRAHDSIRLKVNRPKVRPKSEKVEDTAIDSIPLADIKSGHDDEDANGLNERAVDVKRSSSRKGKKKKDKEEETKENELPVRNFTDVRIIKVVRNENERSLGVTIKAEEGNIVVARIMAGSLADKQGALQVGDLILSVNGREVYTPEQLQEELRKTMNEDTVLMKIVPSFRDELPTLCIYFRALFNYDANEDTLLPCKEVGVAFNQGDILEVVNQEDPNWWQARRVDSENLQTGLIPSQELEERRRAFVIPDYDLATRTSICGTKVSRKSKKKEIYNVGQNCDFDKAELQLYEEVCRTPAFERRTLVLIGANGVGKQALKARLVTSDPERFGTPLPHTSRLPRDGEEDGIHYHFVTRERMEEDIIDGKYLEFGEYDGALYGTKLDSVREIIGSGKVCVLDCSPTCLKILKTSDYLPFVSFIAAPTIDQMRYMQDYARSGSRNYTTFDRALSRQSRRAKTLQDFAFDFFEDEDLQITVEESARLFRVYENYFDIVLVNNNFDATFQQLKDAMDALSMAPQWIPISWIYGT